MPVPRRFKFTHRLIESLPPNPSDAPSREAEYSDTEISGLKCLIGKGEGKKKFLLRYLWQGRKRAISIGHHPELDIATARRIASEMKRQIATGTDPRQVREGHKAIPLLDEAFNDYYLPWAKVHKKSWNKDVQRFRDHIAPLLGHLLLNEVTPRHITQLQSSLCATCQPATNNRVIALLKALFRWSQRQDLIPLNPATNIPLMRENNARQRYFSENEIRKIFDAAAQDNNQVAGIYIRLLLLTGLRRDELRLAKWEHYSEQQGTLWLPETKNGVGRLVHLNTWALNLISELPRYGGNLWMFGGRLPGKPVCNVTKAFKRIIRRAGIPDKDVCIHTCRHSVAALIVSRGGTLYDVQSQLGHRSIQSSQRYAHLHPHRLKATGQLIEKHIGRAILNTREPDPLLY
ncbi:tyrosine-type recombinase/integrase [Yersinia enterocolitica]